MAGFIGNNVVEFSSRSGKFIINIGRIDRQTPPESIDIGVSPKDLDKIIGKEFFASCLYGSEGDVGKSNLYLICPCRYEISIDNDNVYHYELIVQIPDIGGVGLSATSETSTIWTVEA